MPRTHVQFTDRPLLSAAISAVPAVNAASLSQILRRLLVAALAATPLAAHAASYDSDTPGDWNVNTNWNPNFPTGGQGPRVGAGTDSATLLNAMTYGSGAVSTGGVSNDFTISSGGVVNVGNAGTAGSFQQTATGMWIRIGDAGTGTLNIVNGTFRVGTAGNLALGSRAGGNTGIIHVGDGVGGAGQAILNLQTDNKELNLGQSIDGVAGIGQVTVHSDGILQGGNATIRIGRDPNGSASSLQVNSGGTFNVRATLEVGANGGANGQLTSAGTISQTAGTFTIGWNGTGAATFTGGNYTYNAGGETLDGVGGTTIIVGRDDGTGTLNISGGTVTSTANAGRLVTAANSDNDGAPAHGNINLSGAGVLNVKSAHLGFKGDNSANRSVVTMSGASQFNSNEFIAVGEFTRSQVTLNDSAAMKYAVAGTSSMAIGAGSGGIGVLTLNDSSSLSGTGEFNIGHNSGSNGTLTLNGSASVAIIGTANVGRASGAVGLLTINGGDFSSTTLNVANLAGSTGTLDLNGGTLTVGSGGIGGSGTATINLGGGTVAASATWSSARNMTLTGSGGNTTFDTNGNNINLTGNLTGSGGLIKVDNGALTLSGANSYSGNTNVNMGTLALALTTSNNNIASSPTITLASGTTLDVSGLMGTTDLALANGQTLQGTGTMQGNLTVGAGSTIAPGASPGTLSQVGDQTWNNGGMFDFDIDDANASAGGDPGWSLMDITGSLDLASLTVGGFTIDINSLLHPSHDPGPLNVLAVTEYAWDFVHTSGGINGFHPSLFAFDTSGFSSTWSGSFTIRQAGDDLELVFTTIPEPGSIAIWSLLAVIVALGVRKTKNGRN